VRLFETRSVQKQSGDDRQSVYDERAKHVGAERVSATNGSAAERYLQALNGAFPHRWTGSDGPVTLWATKFTEHLEVRAPPLRHGADIRDVIISVATDVG
jgi:hypothetical protein